MSDTKLIYEILSQVRWSTETILKRFEPIKEPEDFMMSDAGMEKLDAMCMQLIAIGESLKKLDKATEGTFLSRYSNIPWKRVMGMRDVISHHYFDVDAEIVYDVCVNYVPDLSETIQQMIDDL